MWRFRIDHPTHHDVHAEAGHDAVIGFFVDLMQGDRVMKGCDFFLPLFNRARRLSCRSRGRATLRAARASGIADVRLLTRSTGPFGISEVYAR
jgi:hypothetical protein